MSDEERVIADLERVLRWYADEGNYRAVQRLQYIAAPAEEDKGNRARRALAALRAAGMARCPGCGKKDSAGRPCCPRCYDFTIPDGGRA